MAKNSSNSKNVWVSLWFHPRNTIRTLLDTRLKDPTIFLLAIINGILAGLSFLGVFWIRYPHRTEFHHPLSIISSIVGGAILGLIQLYFFAWLYKVVGRWLKGVGNFQELKLAVGWSQYPFAIAALLNVIAIFLIHHPILQGIVTFLHFIALIWSVVIVIALISEAHRFSAGRGVGTLLISFVILFIIILIIFFIIGLSLSSFQKTG